ncbi:helix-turn-helix domain-containing protein [Pedosphaera parvula]|uniref:Insertion element IS150 protein InsJ-like helix-turn-helix domain-containing protein n=1 Tax=Pedosphaera parvula (strain Ellin514) TaxID=320771 RepID=B9XJN4_PEDPL|nr:helix-turn-helix domain-containing protein [Pedosphaera parvula]EEF59910.1 hypothetical protein Cflav_PD2714 [Pedosphaera parvula Ellin514]
MDEIIRFVMLAQSARFTVTELCEQFGISRKTGYKHLVRYAADGLQGLAAAATVRSGFLSRCARSPIPARMPKRVLRIDLNRRLS